MLQRRSGQALVDQVAEAMFSPSSSCSRRVSNLDSTLGQSPALSAIVTFARVLQQQPAVDKNAQYVQWK